MIYKLNFIYSPDYQISWYLHKKRLIPNRMWKEVVIQADNEEMAKQIAERFVHEHSFAKIEKLELVN